MLSLVLVAPVATITNVQLKLPLISAFTSTLTCILPFPIPSSVSCFFGPEPAVLSKSSFYLGENSSCFLFPVQAVLFKSPFSLRHCPHYKSCPFIGEKIDFGVEFSSFFLNVLWGFWAKLQLQCLSALTAPELGPWKRKREPGKARPVP